MNKEPESQKSTNKDNPLNSILISGIAFIVGAAMSIYYTASQGHSAVTLMMMLVFVGVISFANWRLIEFIRSGGTEKD